MQIICVLLVIAVVFCILFSDKIDMTAKGNKKVKKVIVVCAVGTIFILLIPMVCHFLLSVKDIFGFEFIRG